MIVINIWGAPSSGKSTVAAGLFFLMKINKTRVELVHEFAKELVLERRENVFTDQNFIFAEQERRLKRLQDHSYDFAITDSPLPLTVLYNEHVKNLYFNPFVLDNFKSYNNLNYLLKRQHPFEPIGRRHNEEQSLQIETDLKNFLAAYEIEYVEIDAGPKTPEIILKDIRSRMLPPVSVLPFDNLDNSKLA